MDRVAHAVPDGGPRVTLLDGFAVRAAGSAGVAGDEELPPSVQRLVAHLCLAGGPARTAVSGRLWPDVPEERARASLRSALWRLRRTVPGLLDDSGSRLRLAPGVRTDVRDLQAWAERVCDPGAGPLRAALPAPALLGDLLPGWYDDWVLLERDRLQQLRLHALETVAARLGEAGRYAEALQAAYLAIRTEPLRESAHRTVVRVHLAEGNLAEALRAHDVFAGLLREELGVAPTERMAGLVRGLPRLRRVS
ncbi:DNA-binding transcriptional activator of the SARP family [Geodermatophilus telluris]|uniref:DNA-binding transcriptional activator of the SARP family n=1 Tax=Geodermatophilus telluris TaxID=1190417 RepID=A0A1G6V5E2_9ACTN|nr:BTAD domain-containing putative transcriptional regulator [Geodermatophilus telluris]SDD48237.1 DNA-binding transcriptional activator of the SARP family [Geodermatophilus telluris]